MAKNITGQMRNARHDAVRKTVERICRETGQGAKQIPIVDITNALVGDASFAACHSRQALKKAVKVAVSAVYGSSKAVPPDDEEIAISNALPPREPSPKDLSKDSGQKSRVNAVIAGLRELDVPEDEITEVRMMMLHSLEKENAELRELYAHAREDATAAWQAVAKIREENELLERKVKNNATHRLLNNKEHLIVFGE